MLLTSDLQEIKSKLPETCDAATRDSALRASEFKGTELDIAYGSMCNLFALAFALPFILKSPSCPGSTVATLLYPL